MRQEIWQNLHDIESRRPRQRWQITSQAKSKVVKPVERQFDVANKHGDAETLRCLLGARAIPIDVSRLKKIIRSRLDGRETTEIFLLALEQLPEVNDPLMAEKIFTSLNNQILDFFTADDDKRIAMVEGMFKKGLVPGSGKMIGAFFNGSPDEQTGLGNWLVTRGLWNYPRQCQGLFTSNNVAFILKYSALNQVEVQATMERVAELVKQGLVTLKGNQKIAKDMRTMCLSLNGEQWKQADFNQLVLNLERLGAPVDLGDVVYEYPASERKVGQAKVGILMEAMLDGSNRLFALLKQNKTLLKRFMAEVAKNQQVIAAVGVESDFFPYLIRAGFDLGTRNNKRETVFFNLFGNSYEIDISAVLHRYLVEHLDVIEDQRNTRKETCFTAWRANLGREPTVKLGDQIMPLKAYQAKLVNEHLKWKLPPARAGQGQGRPRL